MSLGEGWICQCVVAAIGDGGDELSGVDEKEEGEGGRR